MNAKSKAPITVLQLEHELTEAERQYQQTSTSGAFLSSCERLLQASARAKHATDEAARSKEALAGSGRTAQVPGTTGNQSVTAPVNDWLEPARRAAQGIPSLRDLHLVMFPGDKKLDARAGQRKSELNEAEAANSELLIAFDDFSEALEHVKATAEAYVLARLALKAGRMGSPEGASDDESVDDLVLAEIAQLPALKGLEEFYVPR